MSILLQLYSVDKSYTTYLGMDKFIRWIPGGWTAGWRWTALSKLWTTEIRDEASEKLYPLDSDLSIGKELSTFWATGAWTTIIV